MSSRYKTCDCVNRTRFLTSRLVLTLLLLTIYDTREQLSTMDESLITRVILALMLRNPSLAFIDYSTVAQAPINWLHRINPRFPFWAQ